MTIYYKQQITQVHYVYTGVIWIRMSNWQGRVNITASHLMKLRYLCYVRPTRWAWFYTDTSLKQQSTGRYGIPLWHLILIESEPICAPTYEWCVISSKLQMYSLWFDRTEHWVQDLPHSRRVDKIVKVEIFCSTTTVFSEVFRCHPPLKHTSKI
jgi:hypothetical protein